MLQAAQAGPPAARSALPPLTQTRYINTISPEQEPSFPGDEALERRIRRLIRWNAVAMVLRANNRFAGHRRPPVHLRLRGHACTRSASTTSSGARTDPGGGDQIFFQGHAAPGHLRPRLPRGPPDRGPARPLPARDRSGEGLELLPAPAADAGLLGVPDGLDGPRPARRHLPGPLQPLPRTTAGSRTRREQRVWAFLGDGEMDEPESIAGISLAAREGLDNLTFVVNCNLQRLDGPVRGNGKIIQELEGLFRGAGWNVIKVIWGREWDDLLARDVGRRARREDERARVDGEFQKYSVADGRLHPRALLRAGPAPPQAGRAPLRRRPARSSAGAATTTARSTRPTRPRPSTRARPTVILAKTVKGWTLGRGVEARNITHQAKKLPRTSCASSATASSCRSPTRSSREAPYYHPGPDSDEVRYMLERRARPGRPGAAPRRARDSRCRRRRPRSTPSSTAAAPTAGLARRWSSPGCCATSSATRRSAGASSRSSRTRPAPSAWTRCSRRSASTPPSASATTRWTRTWSCPTARRRTARCWRRGSPRRARWPRSRPPARPTRRTASR